MYVNKKIKFTFSRDTEGLDRFEKDSENITALIRAGFDIRDAAEAEVLAQSYMSEFDIKRRHQNKIEVSFFKNSGGAEGASIPLRLVWGVDEKDPREKGWYSFICRIQPSTIEEGAMFLLRLSSKSGKPFVILRQHIEPYCGLMLNE